MTEADWRAFQESPEHPAWWNIHRRSCLGEPVTPDERAFYEAINARHDALEARMFAEAAGRARADIHSSKAENRQLRETNLAHTEEVLALFDQLPDSVAVEQLRLLIRERIANVTRLREESERLRREIDRLQARIHAIDADAARHL
jgi:hypothetical protein